MPSPYAHPERRAPFKERRPPAHRKRGATLIPRPEAAQHVALHLPCRAGQLHHSRLEAIDGARWRVARPLPPPVDAPAAAFPAGADIGISWGLGGGGWAEVS